MGSLKDKSAAEAEELKKQFRAVLKQLNISAKSIEASSVMTSDGVCIASVLGDGCDPDRFSAMCASLLALAETTAREMNRGKLKQVLVEGELGSMLVVRVGDDAVLAVGAGPDVNLGIVFMEAKKAATFLLKLL